MTKIYITEAHITQNEFMCMVRRINNQKSFEYAMWSLWDAEQLEYLAQLIRYGYNKLSTTIKEK